MTYGSIASKHDSNILNISKTDREHIEGWIMLVKNYCVLFALGEPVVVKT